MFSIYFSCEAIGHFLGIAVVGCYQQASLFEKHCRNQFFQTAVNGFNRFYGSIYLTCVSYDISIGIV